MSQTKKIKISLITHEAGPYLMRARSLAAVLSRKYEVEVICPVQAGQPYQDECFNGLSLTLHNVPSKLYPRFVTTLGEMRRAISGDIIYVSKLRPTSFIPALLDKRKNRRPVLLDIDDWEKYLCYPYSKFWAKNSLFSLPRLREPNSYIHTWLTEYLSPFANNITSVSQLFQKRYGGVLLPNGCDTAFFDPACYNRAELRREFNVPDDWKLLMFVGTALPNKGVQQIVKAMALLNRPEVKLVIVGMHTPLVEELLQGQNVLYWGMHPAAETPRFLAMADLVVLPQANLPHSAGQMPMKLFEAMAMALPVIATPVADIAEVLQGCGLITKNDHPEELAQALAWFLQQPEESRKMGEAARQRCEQLYSWNVMEKILDGVLAPYTSPSISTI